MAPYWMSIKISMTQWTMSMIQSACAFIDRVQSPLTYRHSLRAVVLSLFRPACITERDDLLNLLVSQKRWSGPTSPHLDATFRIGFGGIGSLDGNGTCCFITHQDCAHRVIYSTFFLCAKNKAISIMKFVNFRATRKVL